MIKEKFLKVLLWFRDHFHCLLEVVLRLSVGIEKKQLNQNENDGVKDFDLAELQHSNKVKEDDTNDI